MSEWGGHTPGYARDRGISHGYSAAQYAEAYDPRIDRDREATVRAAYEYRSDWQCQDAYREGFAAGWDRYSDGQWPDGSPREGDES